MTRFAILLGGDLTVTPRLKSQIKGARVIAADSGMMHAAALHIMPELWVGDFDSAGSELTMQYRDVPRETFSPRRTPPTATSPWMRRSGGGDRDHPAGRPGRPDRPHGGFAGPEHPHRA